MRIGGAVQHVLVALLLLLLLLLLPLSIADTQLTALCTGGYKGVCSLLCVRKRLSGSCEACVVLPPLPRSAGLETGMIVSLMPPDAPTPTGAYGTPGIAEDGLRLGDTFGATPGAYGLIVSCNLNGYVANVASITSARLVLTISSITGINPLGPAWTCDAGSGPSPLQYHMVRCTSAIQHPPTARAVASQCRVLTHFLPCMNYRHDSSARRRSFKPPTIKRRSNCSLRQIIC